MSDKVYFAQFTNGSMKGKLVKDEKAAVLADSFEAACAKVAVAVQ